MRGGSDRRTQGRSFRCYPCSPRPWARGRRITHPALSGGREKRTANHRSAEAAGRCGGLPGKGAPGRADPGRRVSRALIRALRCRERPRLVVPPVNLLMNARAASARRERNGSWCGPPNLTLARPRELTALARPSERRRQPGERHGTRKAQIPSCGTCGQAVSCRARSNKALAACRSAECEDLVPVAGTAARPATSDYIPCDSAVIKALISILAADADLLAGKGDLFVHKARRTPIVSHSGTL